MPNYHSKRASYSRMVVLRVRHSLGHFSLYRAHPPGTNDSCKTLKCSHDNGVNETTYRDTKHMSFDKRWVLR